MNKKAVLTKDLFNCDIPHLKEFFDKYQYPWEMLPHIKELIKDLLEKGIPGYTLLKEGVLVGENVSIAPTATIIPPAIIGSGTEIRPGCFIRGNLICGDNCALGTSSEFKNAILLYHVQAPHYNYVGDSILGNYAHMGAGSICSNLKSDGKNIVIHGETEIESGLRKIGAILGDYADIGCQSVLNPGTVIGQHTQVYPLSMVRGVVPENSIYKAKDNIVIKEKR
jgi:NDP-sugar pyrophosphorylase family protein